MIEEQAQVIEVKDNELLLQAQTQSACGACSANKGCGTSLLSKVVGRKLSRFHAENTVGANVGDTVIVAISEEALLKGSFMMYLVPLLGMFLMALLADFGLTETLQYRDLLIAFFAIAGFAAGALLARIYFSTPGNASSYAPVVLRKIISHGKLPAD